MTGAASVGSTSGPAGAPLAVGGARSAQLSRAPCQPNSTAVLGATSPALQMILDAQRPGMASAAGAAGPSLAREPAAAPCASSCRPTRLQRLPSGRHCSSASSGSAAAQLPGTARSAAKRHHGREARRRTHGTRALLSGAPGTRVQGAARGASPASTLTSAPTGQGMQAAQHLAQLSASCAGQPAAGCFSRHPPPRHAMASRSPSTWRSASSASGTCSSSLPSCARLRGGEGNAGGRR